MNITHDIEVSWKNIHLSSQSIVSVYVATPAGVIRHYPGMAVAAMKIRDPNRWVGVDFYSSIQ